LADLHLHTPASSDYQEPQVGYLDVLLRSEARGLDIIAFTDHNTVSGYRKMREEIEQYEFLERLGRLAKEEKSRLAEYRRLLAKLLVLPGFEFTATFGFHILAIFSPEKDIRELEHLLLSLRIPAQLVDSGSSTVGATTDVLSAYQQIDEAGGLVIAAHANSSNGVAMRGFSFGGQTKIAYTQSEHLHALEVTDLDQRGRRSSAGFFDGTKPEYPRRMHVIQGSDAHRLRTDPVNKKNLGVGDRATQLMLKDMTFQAVKELFQSQDFARARPYWPVSDTSFDFIQQAREAGPSIVQAFHPSMAVHGGGLYDVISDVCALANTNGGTLYIGLSGDPKDPILGIPNADKAVDQLQREIAKKITPPINCQVDTQETKGRTVIRVLVPKGDDPPYAVDDNKVYVREEVETGLAVRDEIVQLVLRGKARTAEKAPPPASEPAEATPFTAATPPPRTGVEIVGSEERGAIRYFTLRDLRNGNLVKNVTRDSARRLWHYAISQHVGLPQDPTQGVVAWQGELGLLREQKRREGRRFDLVQRSDSGIRFYYGVTEDGIHGEWKRLVKTDAE
jgi:hypothetical protein